jgi:mono/diheme cytochrome c family protein
VKLYHQTQMLLRSNSASLVAALGSLTLAVLASGCRSLPASKPEALWTVQEARGAQVYHAKCAKCHNPNTTRPLNGPGLQALTKIKAMPSGAPPTDERITAVILHGRNNMPITHITDDELQDLLAYLHTL